VSQLEVQQPYADGVDPLQNPKDRIGVTKVPLWLVPSAGIIHEAMGFSDGAVKYGPYNWRAKQVLATIYVSAALRHIYQYLDGEDFDGESGAHHLGHARACLGIILDAEATGNLKDDRPLPSNTAGLLSALRKVL
jgi:hypothetical protein